MATSKITREDAQEWLESLQQVGEGWWRQVGLAVKANAHKSLGMERREFAAQIGQRLIDPREAIVELYKQGHSQNAIGDMLGVAPSETVARVLYEEGLVKELPSWVGRKINQRKDDSATRSDQRKDDSIDSTADDLDELVSERDQRIAELEDQLDLAVKAARNAGKEEIQNLKDQLKEKRASLHRLTRELEQAREEGKSEQQLLREQQEREAAVAAIEAKFTPMLVAGAVSALKHARSQVQELVSAEGITERQYEQVGAAYDQIGHELEVLAAKIGVEA
jgi:hypothetical protein